MTSKFHRRQVLGLLGLAALPWKLKGDGGNPSPTEGPGLFVMDGHVHMIDRQFYLGGDISDHYTDGQVDLPRMRKGGVNAVFMSLFVTEAYYANRYELKLTLDLIDLALRQLKRDHKLIELALNASDIERIYKSGKIAAFMHLEGGFDLDGDLSVLHDLYRLGLRSAQLPAHNYTNNFADSCCAAPRWGGINAHGVEVVHEMNRLGMVIDVSHGSDATMRQAAEASSDPVLYSHGGSLSIVNTPRNISDETAKIIASKGGLVGLQFGNFFNNPKYAAWVKKRAAEHHTTGPRRAPRVYPTIQALNAEVAKSSYPPKGQPIPEELRMPVDQYVVVLDHWINVVGEDHVSLGADFDGWGNLARGMHDVGDYQMIIQAMRRHGYSDGRVRKIAGLNLLRLVRQVTEKS